MNGSFNAAALTPGCIAAVEHIQQDEDVSAAVDVLEAGWQADRDNVELGKALVWALCTLIESGVHIDSIEADVLRAETAWAELVETEQPIPLRDRLSKLQAAAARVAAEREGLDLLDQANLTAQQAADLGYAAKDPAKAARYFEIAAGKLDKGDHQAAWYRKNAAMNFARAKHWEAAVPRLDATMVYALQVGYESHNEVYFCSAGIELVLHAALFDGPKNTRSVWRAVVDAYRDLTKGAPDPYPLVWVSTPSHFDLIEALMTIDCDDVLDDLLAAMRVSTNFPPKGARKTLFASAEARVAARNG